VWVMHSSVNDFKEDWLLQHAERILALRAKAVIGVTQKNIDEYVQVVGEPPSLCFVVPNGVDASRFRIGESAVVEHVAGAAVGEEEDMPRDKLIVQIGRYTPEKSQVATVRAFKRVLEHEPHARLLLCGIIENRAYYAALTALVDELGLGAHVELKGPQADVAKILGSASVFAMPSSFEAHSIGFLEALASGIPIVANSIAAFTFARAYAGVQLIDTGNTELYGRALIAALAEPRAERLLDRLTLEDTANRYLDIAWQVLG
ncbi:MAG TPA: glycosyltransferase family 4 protein, partial [Trinickia sp.]|nr:glycosyltransferase family 4 protein [Trinickia sp.]